MRHEPEDFDDLDDLQAEDIYTDDDEPEFMDIESVAPGDLSSSQLDRITGVEDDVPESEVELASADPLTEFRTPAARRDIEEMKRIEEQRRKREENK